MIFRLLLVPENTQSNCKSLAMKYLRPQFPAGATSNNNTPSNTGSSRSASTNQTTYENILTPVNKDRMKQRIDLPGYINNDLIDLLTNNFSNSFNSLILDDIKENILSSKKKKSQHEEQDSSYFSIERASITPSIRGNKKKINKSPPFNLKHDIDETNFYDTQEEESDFNERRSHKLLNSQSFIDKYDESHEGATGSSQQSSIKRSLKYLNLSINSNLMSLHGSQKSDDTPSLTVREMEDLIDVSSPIASRTPFHNKFKRPHELISQSPSPSHNKIKATRPSLQEKQTPERNILNKHENKGLRLFKNSTGDVFSPINTSPEVRKTPKFFSSRLSTNKVRKTNISANKSPFNKLTSSPNPGSNDFYPFDDIDIDSPSKLRKHSNSSNVSIAYQEPEDNYKKPKIYINKTHEFDDKENRSYNLVKPLQTAFKSTGLIKKNSISMESRKLPPETPIKRNPLTLLNTNRLNMSNMASNNNDEYDEHLEVSIEIGRNFANNSTINDSTSSFFKIPSTANSQKTNTANILNSEIDFNSSSDLDISIPETPTKSFKKSHSMPANFSPVQFKKLNNKFNLLRTSYEPSTPIHSSMIQSSESLTQTESSKDQKHFDEHLVSKFGINNIKYINSGEFSLAYECSFQGQKLAIKRSKKPIIGRTERKAILREIEALRILTSVKDNEKLNMQEQEEGKEYLVYFIEAWNFNNYYYIMTEFCDNGTLSDFLEEHKNYKIDEFRIWKILIEILSGVLFIHLKNFLHLDIKPANIFVTFEGSLKIGDFGLATKLPILEKDFDLEGDRNYIAPELINDKIYSPFADIFSVGLIILEIAANIILPDNGTPWRKLRSGDLSDAGKLSSDNISDFLQHRNFSSLTSYNSMENSNQSLRINSHLSHPSKRAVEYPGTVIDLIPPTAPQFLVNGDSMNLDKLVNRMLKPNPFDRPTARNILEMNECVAIENIRKEGATIFEGEFGPNPDDD